MEEGNVEVLRKLCELGSRLRRFVVVNFVSLPRETKNESERVPSYLQSRPTYITPLAKTFSDIFISL